MDVVSFLFRILAILIAMNQLQADEKAKEQKIFRQTGIGPSLQPEDIISNHQVHADLDCCFQCLKKSTCVGFNYRSKSYKCQVNCQLSNKTRQGESDEVGEWTFYEDILAKKPVSPFVIGSKLNPGMSCKDIQAKNNLSSGIYWIKINLDALFQIYCDMKTHGGGWSLVYSYTFTNYNSFSSRDNAVTPRPNWPARRANVQISTTPPLDESLLGAVNWTLWKNIGQEFMIKSNINDWIVCQPGNGSIVEEKEGSLSCQNIKDVATACKGAEPTTIKWLIRGPSLSFSSFYYSFEGDTNDYWPTHDPCGGNELKHKKGVNNPGGQIYLR